MLLTQNKPVKYADLCDVEFPLALASLELESEIMKFHNETGQQRTLPVQEHEAPRRRQLPAPTYSEWTQIRICMDMHGYAGYEGIAISL